MDSKVNLKMLPLAPDELQAIANRYCVQISLISRLIRLLQLIRSIEVDGLAIEEAEILYRLAECLEGQVSAVLYPALVEDGIMLMPDSAGEMLRIL